MKNKIILLVSLALLLGTINAFAQVNNQNFDNNMNQLEQELQDRKKANEEYAKELAKPWTTHTLQEGYTRPQHDPYIPPPPYPEDVVSDICGEDKYCLEIATIWDYTGVPFEEASVKLQNIKNYKLTLYKMKYSEIVFDIETDKSGLIRSVKDAEDFLMDMPTNEMNLSRALNRIIKYYKGTPEERDFIMDIIPVLENLKFCPKNLDVNNYGLHNFCIIPEGRTPDISSTIENLKKLL